MITTWDKQIPGIGRSIVRPDAAAKVTGAEKYAVDHYDEDMLWAGVKRAGAAHGLIRRVDTDAAKRLPGVVAVLVGSDVPGTNRQGMVHKDQPVIADHKVRYRGDAVALVLARDRAVLQKALDLIEVDIEPLPAVFTVDEALEPGAPLVHEDHPGGNVLLRANIAVGDAPKDHAMYPFFCTRLCVNPY